MKFTVVALLITLLSQAFDIANGEGAQPVTHIPSVSHGGSFSAEGGYNNGFGAHGSTGHGDKYNTGTPNSYDASHGAPVQTAAVGYSHNVNINDGLGVTAPGFNRFGGGFGGPGAYNRFRGMSPRRFFVRIIKVIEPFIPGGMGGLYGGNFLDDEYEGNFGGLQASYNGYMPGAGYHPRGHFTGDGGATMANHVVHHG